MKTMPQPVQEKEEKLDGIPTGPFTEEELKAEKERIAQEKIKIISDLNKIKYPINATVFTHGQSWTVRNEAFWKAMQQKDEDLLKFMHNYLSETR